MLNENIKNLRKSKGLSQEELAVKLNVVRQTVSKWENGLSVPDADMLIALSQVLDTPVSTLLGQALAPAESDDLKAISEKLEVINLQLARKKTAERRFLRGLLMAVCILTVVLFVLLAVLEDVGYMARIAFIMDRIFRRFGLSGKSFIPCGAKMPIIGLFAGAVFGNSAWVATSAYFIGVAAVIVSGIMLKKFKAFAGEPAPFVMELPAYHAPSAGNVLRATWERGWSFIKRAGTVILISSIILWFLQGYGFVDGVFQAVEDNNDSLLAVIGNAIAWIFYPLGWTGSMAWKAAVATFTGLIAKEEVVNTFGVLYHYAGDIDLMEDSSPIWAMVGADFGAISAYSFMIFNLLCAPCFAAMGAIKREMHNTKWTLGAIGYMCLFAYVTAMIVYQIGGLFTGEAAFSVFTVIAIALLAGIIFLLVRRGYQPSEEVRHLTDIPAGKK